MGRLDVHIRHGSSGGSTTALVVLGAMALMAVCGGSIAATAASVASTLLITVAVVVGIVVVGAIVLAILFRKRIFRSSVVEWHGRGADPSAKQPQHVHFHYHAAPGGPPGQILPPAAWGELASSTYDRPELEVEPDAARDRGSQRRHPDVAPVHRRIPR